MKIMKHSIKIFFPHDVCVLCKNKWFLQVAVKETGDQATVLRWKYHSHYTHYNTQIPTVHILEKSITVHYWRSKYGSSGHSGNHMAGCKVTTVNERGVWWLTALIKLSEDVSLLLPLCPFVACHPPGCHSVQPQTVKLFHQVQAENVPSSLFLRRRASSFVFCCWAWLFSTLVQVVTGISRCRDALLLQQLQKSQWWSG